MTSSAILVVLLSTVPARAQQAGSTSSAIARSVPGRPDHRHVFVLDSAHLLTEAEIGALQDSAAALQRTTGADIAFVTLPTLLGGSVEDAARTIGRTWEIGSAGTLADPTRGRGVVILYVPNEGTVAGANLRIEVGRGLEGAITDGGGSRQVIEAMKPGLRAKRYGEGFLAGYATAAALVRAENAAIPRVRPAATPPPDDDAGRGLGFVIVIALLVMAGLIFLITVVQGRRARSPGRRSDGGSSAPGPTRFDSDSSSEAGAWSRGGNTGDTGSSSVDTSSVDTSSGGSFGGGGDFSGGGTSDSV